jgi:hypothetical protein
MPNRFDGGCVLEMASIAREFSHEDKYVRKIRNWSARDFARCMLVRDGRNGHLSPAKEI